MENEQVLLLCDVVESTALTERLGDAAAALLWRAHDGMARGLLTAWRGREVDKTDGLFALFDNVADALAFATAYHAALSAMAPPLQARVAIHRAPVFLRQTPAAEIARGAKPLDVDGIAKPLTARIGALALCGQTLLSETAASALATEPRLNPLGHWHFKGVSEPMALFEPAAQPLGPPPDADKAWRVTHNGGRWLPTREVPHSLQAERDSFVGRRQALAELAAAFAGEARLVSVLGVGGTGKTRLALHHGWDALGGYAGGVWFCDLSQALSFDGVVHAVAQGLQLPLGAGDPVVQIGNAIASRGVALVILDNFEQVARHAEQTLGAWLGRAPQAQFLVTSREVLGMAGETVFALPPLDSHDAVELFLRRAKAAHQGFAPSAADRSAVDQLAKSLDGLPLAIELAAARVRVMPPQVLLQRMHRRFDLLLSRGGRPDRQATLRATLDWSWDLLDATERSVLSQLAVFQGNFGADAADAVVALSDRRACIDILGSLVDKSLVRQLDGYRFGLLESVRDYAALRLHDDHSEDGDAAGMPALRSRHWRHFGGLSEQAAVAQRCADLDNLAAACRAACEAGDAHSATRCLVNAWAALKLVGPYRAAVELAMRVATMPAVSANEAGLVQWVWGAALDRLGEVDAAREHFRRGLDRTASATPCEATARLLLALGSQLTLEGDLAQAQAHLERAHWHATELRHDWLQANALNALGRLMDHQAKVVEARQLYGQALVLARALGDRHLEGGLLGNLGGLHHDLGELETARLHYEQALAAAEEVGDRRWLGNACSNLGLLLLDQGHHAEARARLDQARELARSAGNVRLEYTVACNLGILLTAQGRLTEAEQQMHSAVEAAARVADRRSEGQFRGYLAVTQARLGQLDEARATLALGEQALQSLSDRLSLALLMCDRAEVEWLAGRTAAARQMSDGAKGVADEMACGADSELRRRIQTVTALFGG